MTTFVDSLGLRSAPRSPPASPARCASTAVATQTPSWPRRETDCRARAVGWVSTGPDAAFQITLFDPVRNPTELAARAVGLRRECKARLTQPTRDALFLSRPLRQRWHLIAAHPIS